MLTALGHPRLMNTQLLEFPAWFDRRPQNSMHLKDLCISAERFLDYHRVGYYDINSRPNDAQNFRK